jgi:SET domain
LKLSYVSEVGIFLKASGVNHSCDPNSHSAWNEETNQLTIHILKDVGEGIEITINYLEGNKGYQSYQSDINQTYSSRQSNLRQIFNFTCTCTLCSMSPVSRQQSDNQLNQIFFLDSFIHRGLNLVNSPLSCIKYAHKMFQRLKAEGIIDARMARFYYFTSQIVIAHGDQARAKVFLERAHSIWVTLQGNDHPGTRRLSELVSDPTEGAHEGSKKWESTKDDVPQSLTEQELNVWLFAAARETALPDLRRDSMYFLTGRDVPAGQKDLDAGIDSYFFRDGNRTPTKHWCFFGEVIGIRRANRRVRYPMLRVCDKNADEVRLYRHAKRLLEMGVHERQTIAILYAESTAFGKYRSDVVSSRGDAGMIKVRIVFSVYSSGIFTNQSDVSNLAYRSVEIKRSRT